MKRLLLALGIVCILAGLMAGIASTATAAGVYPNSVTYRGQGLTADGFGGYDLNKEICGVENGADVDGPYLLFVLTATGASNADITGPWGSTVPMTKTGNGTFKYISGWYEPSTLTPNVVSATYDGKAKNAQLTISHGCRPFTHGAWCSPGFWKNATREPTVGPPVTPFVSPGAWPLIGHLDTELFNATVVPNFYSTPTSLVPPDGPTLNTVLTTAGANTFGGVSGPYDPGMNAFNATGAYLTDSIPGYDFSNDARLLNNESDTCPIDHFGNFKVATP